MPVLLILSLSSIPHLPSVSNADIAAWYFLQKINENTHTLPNLPSIFSFFPLLPFLSQCTIIVSGPVPYQDGLSSKEQSPSTIYFTSLVLPNLPSAFPPLSYLSCWWRPFSSHSYSPPNSAQRNCILVTFHNKLIPYMDHRSETCIFWFRHRLSQISLFGAARVCAANILHSHTFPLCFMEQRGICMYQTQVLMEQCG